MIESIQIVDVATYGSTPVNGLLKFNFFFGSNATGKTTITRVIANETAFPNCEIRWKRGKKLEPMVYNQDFVKHNFNQVSEIKGIFTLGQKKMLRYLKKLGWQNMNLIL